jgi:hypothetical protein
MTEPLIVDPPRLKDAGHTLRGLSFPAAPPPMVVSGTDAVSAAINETLPEIESPVIDGLPAVKAAVTRTGSSIVTAADMYAETDQTLGDHVGKVQFLSAGEKPANGGPGNRLVGTTADKPADGESPGAPAPPPTQRPFDQLPTQAGQIAAVAGAMGPVTQNVQTVTSTLQGAMGNVGGAPPAQAQLVDEKTGDGEGPPEAFGEGAAPGEQTLGSVAAQSHTPDRTDLTPSALDL